MCLLLDVLVVRHRFEVLCNVLCCFQLIYCLIKTIVCTPMELIKIQMQVTRGKRLAVMDTAKAVVKKHVSCR
jgi:hypothetical protein